MNHLSQTLHKHCFACGAENPDGLGLKFAINKEDLTVSCDFSLESKYQGYDNLTHGGILATILDCAMVHCLFARHITAVTVELNVKYRHPVDIDTPTTVTAQLLEQSHGIYQLSARISQFGQTKTIAKARFYNNQHGK